MQMRDNLPANWHAFAMKHREVWSRQLTYHDTLVADLLVNRARLEALSQWPYIDPEVYRKARWPETYVDDQIRAQAAWVGVDPDDAFWALFYEALSEDFDDGRITPVVARQLDKVFTMRTRELGALWERAHATGETQKLHVDVWPVLLYILIQPGTTSGYTALVVRTGAPERVFSEYFLRGEDGVYVTGQLEPSRSEAEVEIRSPEEVGDYLAGAFVSYAMNRREPALYAFFYDQDEQSIADLRRRPFFKNEVVPSAAAFGTTVDGKDIDIIGLVNDVKHQIQRFTRMLQQDARLGTFKPPRWLKLPIPDRLPEGMQR